MVNMLRVRVVAESYQWNLNSGSIWSYRSRESSISMSVRKARPTGVE